MFISSAFAQDAAQAAVAQSPLGQFLPLILFGAVLYFFLIRPQQKRMRDHQAMIGALRRGDRVVTAGGIIGVVTRIEDDKQLVVEIADGVQVKVVRSTIGEVLTKSNAPEAKAANDAALNPGKTKAKK